jgi:hypothetical protein
MFFNLIIENLIFKKNKKNIIFLLKIEYIFKFQYIKKKLLYYFFKIFQNILKNE